MTAVKVISAVLAVNQSARATTRTQANTTTERYIQYRSSFQSSTLIGRAVTRSQTSLGVRARFRSGLGFRAGYDVFRMYAVLISTNQIRALKITPGYGYLDPAVHVILVCACSDNQAARANQGRGRRSHIGGGRHR